MMNESKTRGDGDTHFSFAVQELRRGAEALVLEKAPVKPPKVDAGSDPYNTSGSFDRKKHWERVGKR